jgi:alkylated DNA repair dioxygenase AlkB
MEKIIINTSKNYQFKTQDINFYYYPNFFNETDSTYFYEKLSDTIEWKQDKIKIFGKLIDLPRLTAWYGDNGKNYSYSGIKMIPNAWTEELLQIKNRIKLLSDVDFNSVLLNLYRNGNDHQSWHSDDEKELGENITIASVNFGQSRDFVFKHKFKKEKKKIYIRLASGSFLLMKHPTQLYWFHSVPKRKKIKANRINLTFRKII